MMATMMIVAMMRAVSEHYRHSVLMVKIITVMKLNTVGVIVKVRCCDNDDDYNGIANDDDYDIMPMIMVFLMVTMLL